MYHWWILKTDRHFRHPVGAVSNRPASAQLETLLAIPIYRGAPTKRMYPVSVQFVRTYALQIVVARFIGRWQQCPAAMNRRTTGL